MVKNWSVYTQSFSSTERSMNMRVRKAVFPVAGHGTRFLPATKASPKEMLALIDKPLVQYVVEEAVASGIEQVLFVTGRNKRAIEDHFDISFELEAVLKEKNKDCMLREVREIAEMVDIFYCRQKEAMGLGHAILCARDFIGDEPFAVLLGDDIIDAGTPCLAQMIDCFNTTNAPVVALERVPLEEISSYGCVSAVAVDERTYEITDLVEKPMAEDAPSDLAIIGRYILTPDIFPILQQQRPGKGGEIQITDALLSLLGKNRIFGYRFDGTRYDCGDKLGFLMATVEMALRRPEFNGKLRAFLERLLTEAPVW
jgi:UTP--glucose-1-phosphate uridylyltransferase